MMPNKAYDIEMLSKSVLKEGERGHGWCFGLPPGITPQQWPLDPHNGYPLMHGFTLLLPEEYRCHGPEIIGLSFFSAAPDQNDGGPLMNATVKALLKKGCAPSDPDLLPFWNAMHDAHPRLFRMEDILGCSYAVILLTEAEFNGPFCMPPDLAENPYLDEAHRPGWMQTGGALSFWNSQYSPALPLPAEEYDLYKKMGRVPDAGLAFNRALRWFSRVQDPNAGIAPLESWSEAIAENGYQPYFYWQDGVSEVENYREHEWGADHLANHIGGTMRPVQSIPAGFSSYYIGFDEEFGGYNFGGGNAQLDFKNMKFDWACG